MGQSPCDAHCNYFTCACKQGKAEMLVVQNGRERRGMCTHPSSPSLPICVMCVMQVCISLHGACGRLCFCGGLIILYTVHVCACACT